MLRAVTFDFWGTLYQNAYAREERLEILQEELKAHGHVVPDEELQEAHRRGRIAVDRIWREERRSIAMEEWIAAVLNALDVELPTQRIEALVAPIEEAFLSMGEPHPVPGVQDVLPQIAQRYRLGIISDVGLTPGRVLRQILERDGLRTHFDTFSFSDEVGMTKPRPEIFLQTLERLGATPKESAHVGDLPETDLTGARAVGMRTVLFLSVSHRDDGLEMADAAFEDYRELPDILAGF